MFDMIEEKTLHRAWSSGISAWKGKTKEIIATLGIRIWPFDQLLTRRTGLNSTLNTVVNF